MFLQLNFCKNNNGVIIPTPNHNLLQTNILKKIDDYNIVFYKDYNMLTMTGIVEKNLYEVRFPFVFVIHDSLHKPNEIYFNLFSNSGENIFKYDNRFKTISENRGYYNIKYFDNYFVDFYSSNYGIPECNISYYYPKQSTREVFLFECKDYLGINNHFDFSDTCCMLVLYRKSFMIKDTIFWEEYSFDCCDFDDPPYKERSTYGMYQRKDILPENLKNAPELSSYEYKKFYEQDNKLVIEHYYNGNKTVLTKTYYDKSKYISLTWLYALKTY